jgi:hypothetical protein
LARPIAEACVGEEPDSPLVRAILGFYDQELAAGRLTNPIGALRDMLTMPGDWGFDQTDAGWQQPATADAQPGQRTARRLQRAEREAGATRREIGLAMRLEGADLDHFIRYGRRPDPRRSEGA